MARSRTEDLLQTHAFWLADVAPGLIAPNFVFDLSMGFASVTAPEVSLDTIEVVDGTSPWKRKVTGKGSVSTMTLSRGVRAHDSDCWRWIQDALYGSRLPRRTLALFHLSMTTTDSSPGASVDSIHELALVSARVFVLFGCMPVRYKSGSDFDGKSGEVSIQELDIEVERMEQLVLGRA